MINRKLSNSKKAIPYLLLLPAFIYYAVFWLTPVFSGMVEAFTDAHGQFTFENFTLMFHSELFDKAVMNTAICASRTRPGSSTSSAMPAADWNLVRCSAAGGSSGWVSPGPAPAPADRDSAAGHPHCRRTARPSPGSTRRPQAIRRGRRRWSRRR